MEQLLNKNEIIENIKTGKKLRLYCVMPVYMGVENRLIRYEYYFFNEDNRSKKIKHIELKEMLLNRWRISNQSN